MLRLAVRVQRRDAEIVLAELLELAPGGVEEVAVAPDLVEYALYGPPGELPELPDLRAAAGEALVEVTSREIPDDWAERWREFHQPLVLPGRLTVRPPWAPAGRTPIDVVIDPGQAFGTGAHATTRLCLELLLELPARGSLLDLGCGSGVLAIAAARLGFSPVLALDFDPASVAATQANAAANGVALEVRRHDLRRSATPLADTIAANLLGPLLRSWAAEPARSSAGGWRSRAGGWRSRVIASGMLEAEADGVAAAFGECGLVEVTRRVRGEWAALVLEPAA